jgi:CheY-like chemotaxis protein
MRFPRRFIVVDDDPMNNLICKHAIHKFDNGAEVLLFTEPEKALVVIKETYENLTQSTETVLFLDINMPTMSGWEFLEIFRDLNGSVHSQIEIYILSSSIDENDKKKAMHNAFVKGYLPKPLSVQMINEIMQTDQ